MHVKQITVNKIEVTKFDFKNSSATIEVQFQDEDPLTFKFQIQKNHQLIAKKLIEQIKENKKETKIDFDDDIFGNVSLIHLQNDEEKLYEHIFKGLLRLDSKVKNLQMNPTSNAYMDTLYKLKNLTEVLYRNT